MPNRAMKQGGATGPAVSPDEFEKAFDAFLMPDRLPTKGVTKLAITMVRYAQENHDRAAWEFVFAVFDRYLEAGKAPPRPILRAVNEALTRYRGPECKSLDEAFFGKRRRGQPKSDDIVNYWWEKTDVSLLQHFLKKHESDPDPKPRGTKSPLERAHDDLVNFRRAGNGGKTPRGYSFAETKRKLKRFNNSE